MNITYKGKQEVFYPAQTEKLEAKFAKLAKMLDGRGEKQAHVILNQQRSIHTAEITVNYLDHALIGAGSDADQFLAINAAIEKLEKQVMKVKEKRRDTKGWDKETSLNAALAADVRVEEPPAAALNGRPRVFRVDPHTVQKPMTAEEAVIEMEADGAYFVYEDADRKRLSVLIRRSDGNFDLIES
ncbi:MAG TPA: ribosome-associated translation inhibitor RaiA [Bryobacteraceae bacterium]|nr:ribosome-associated translation inhibitor RaiA [Bryobacteraceae bacterium]